MIVKSTFDTPSIIQPSQIEHTIFFSLPFILTAASSFHTIIIVVVILTCLSLVCGWTKNIIHIPKTFAGNALP